MVREGSIGSNEGLGLFGTFQNGPVGSWRVWEEQEGSGRVQECP